MTKAAEQKVVARAWTLGKGAPYSALVHNRAHFAGWVIAAAAVAGYIRLNKLSVTATKSGDFELFKDIVGKSAKRTWTASGRITAKQITANGLNEMNARLSNQDHAFATDMEIVKAEVAAIKKGGTLKLDDTEYKLIVPIA